MFSTLQLKLIGLVVALAVVGGAIAYVYQRGKAAGYTEGAAAQLDIDRKQAEMERAEFLKKLDAYEANKKQLEGIVDMQDKQIAKSQASRQAVRDAVNRMPDAEVTKELATLDQRTLLDMVKEYPHILEELQATKDKVATLEQEVKNERERGDAAQSAYDKLYPAYVKAYNAAQKHHNLFVKIITLGIVHDKKMDLPSPTSVGRGF